ncbi:MAG TPA: biosynthetic arginine decarboxylase, partial [Myxococcota bacterium]
MTMDRRWAVQDSAELYHIPAWGSPYFGVNERGNLTVMPRGRVGDAGEGQIDLKELVDDLTKRGISAPILVRFNDILESRVADLSTAFYTSIAEYGYQGRYRGVMPIKVNQQRHVVEELVRAGRKYNLGLEAGSKAELLVAMALLEPASDKDVEPLLILNGYKDSEYVETALDAQRLGIRPFLVLDRFAELELVLKVSIARGVKPHIGMRARLTSKGAGKWQESSGDRSKFGLSASEICRAVEVLKQHDMLDCLELLHFHIGSQITAIRSVKDAIREATRVYQDLRKMGAENLLYVDVGGGLAVDYDGSKTNFHSSRNYSNQEYANDIVSQIQDACDRDKAPHPTIITEAGRALVAHHAVLVFNVLGTNEMANPKVQEELKPAAAEHTSVQAMWEAYQGVTNKNFQESFNDANTIKDEAETLFSAGVIDLRTRARIEDLFWAVSERVQRTTLALDYVPDDLAGLKKTL